HQKTELSAGRLLGALPRTGDSVPRCGGCSNCRHRRRNPKSTLCNDARDESGRSLQGTEKGYLVDRKGVRQGDRFAWPCRGTIRGPPVSTLSVQKVHRRSARVCAGNTNWTCVRCVFPASLRERQARESYALFAVQPGLPG